MVVVLVVCIIGLGSFIIYDKYIKLDNTDDCSLPVENKDLCSDIPSDSYSGKINCYYEKYVENVENEIDNKYDIYYSLKEVLNNFPKYWASSTAYGTGLEIDIEANKVYYHNCEPIIYSVEKIFKTNDNKLYLIVTSEFDNPHYGYNIDTIEIDLSNNQIIYHDNIYTPVNSISDMHLCQK